MLVEKDQLFSMIAAAALALTAMVAGWQYFEARTAKQTAEEQTKVAIAEQTRAEEQEKRVKRLEAIAFAERRQAEEEKNIAIAERARAQEALEGANKNNPSLKPPGIPVAPE